MKVLLVYYNSMLENALPIGLSQLSACLKQAGIAVELFDATFYRYGPKKNNIRVALGGTHAILAPCVKMFTFVKNHE